MPQILTALKWYFGTFNTIVAHLVVYRFVSNHMLYLIHILCYELACTDYMDSSVVQANYVLLCWI